MHHSQDEVEAEDWALPEQEEEEEQAQHYGSPDLQAQARDELETLHQN